MKRPPDAMTALLTRNDRLISELTPYVVATPTHRGMLDLAPLGLTILPENIIDPTRVASERFLAILQAVDALTFGPEGMPMARWLFYDCAELPGATFGFARRAETMPDDVRTALGLQPGETGLVPLSMYVAIPMQPPGVWFGHNLSSLNPSFPGLGLKGLASITKALALVVFRCATQVGVTQWDADALHIHTRFGPLELLSAWTPAHLEAATLTYRFTVTEERVRYALGDPRVTLEYPAPDFAIEPGDTAAMQRLQTRIESGEQFVIAGPPAGSHRRVPIARI